MLLLWYFTQNLVCDSWEIQLQVHPTRAIDRTSIFAPLLVGSRVQSTSYGY